MTIVVSERKKTRVIQCDGCHEPLSEEPSDQFVTLLSKDHSYSFCRLGCVRVWALRYEVGERHA